MEVYTIEEDSFWLSQIFNNINIIVTFFLDIYRWNKLCLDTVLSPGLIMVIISGMWRANCSAASAAHLSVSTLRRRSLKARQTALQENSKPPPSQIPAHPPRHPAPPEPHHAPALILHLPAITSVRTPQQGNRSRKAGWITGLFGCSAPGLTRCWTADEGLCTCTDIAY